MVGVVHGIDVVECRRIAELRSRHGERFLKRVFTARELADLLPRRQAIEALAGRFAAKEAILKVLGTGWRGGIAWTDMEIVNDAAGRPVVRLSGCCARLAEERGIREISVSITHIRALAIASAVALTEK